MKWSDAQAGVTKAEVICQKPQKCEGAETYDINLDGSFLSGLGKGIIITKVLEVNTSIGSFEDTCCVKKY